MIDIKISFISITLIPLMWNFFKLISKTTYHQ